MNHGASAKAGPTLVFGQDPESYLAFRPEYPDDLFLWLRSLVNSDALAWDCGSGSGQAALGLARHFRRVVATDLDPQQLAVAPARANIDYRLGAAEADLGLRAEVDLIACACSIHWFDLERFYANAKRALKPQGVIVAWTYDWPYTGSKPVDAVLATLRDDILGPFWDEASTYYFGRYENLPFPFAPIACPPFFVPIAHSREELGRFLGTWSALKKYRQQEKADPLTLIEKDLDAAWRLAPPALPLCIPLHMRAGRFDPDGP
jgi:SAM-dependent methyltransferase